MTIQADHNSGAKFSDYTTAPIENERAIDEADVNTASVVDRLKRVGGCSESLHNKSLRVNASTSRPSARAGHSPESGFTLTAVP
jgi:hypothetical protein